MMLFKDLKENQNKACAVGTFCWVPSAGLVGVEVGECFETGVEIWLLEPVPLAERAR